MVAIDILGQTAGDDHAMPDNNPDPGRVRELLRGVIREELANYQHECRFNLSDKEAGQISHMAGMMKDLGNGRLDAGIEVIRDNHKWLRDTRTHGQKLTFAVYLLVLTTMASGAIYALWEGIRHMLGLKVN